MNTVTTITHTTVPPLSSPDQASESNPPRLSPSSPPREESSIPEPSSVTPTSTTSNTSPKKKKDHIHKIHTTIKPKDFVIRTRKQAAKEQQLQQKQQQKQERKQQLERKYQPNHKKKKKNHVKKRPPPSTNTAGNNNNNNNNNTGRRYAEKQVDKWNKRYQEAKMYASQHGHCIIPNEYEQNPALGSWAKRQRYQYQVYQKNIACPDRIRLSSMSPERIDLLEQIGFCWHHKDHRWLVRYKELVEFTRKYGHAAVPTQYEPNQELAGWVKVQRRQYKLLFGSPAKKDQSSMTLERVAMLNQIGMVWAMKDIPTSKLSPRKKKTAKERDPVTEKLLLLTDVVQDDDSSEMVDGSEQVSLIKENNDDDDDATNSTIMEPSNEDHPDRKDANLKGTIIVLGEQKKKKEKVIDEKEAVLALLSFGG